MAEIIFISGIDTDAGKSYATGFLARLLAEEGKKVVTQKFIQTGNTGFSEDIELHRLLTATGPLGDRNMAAMSCANHQSNHNGRKETQKTKNRSLVRYHGKFGKQGTVFPVKTI